MFYFKEV